MHCNRFEPNHSPSATASDAPENIVDLTKKFESQPAVFSLTRFAARSILPTAYDDRLGAKIQDTVTNRLSSAKHEKPCNPNPL